MEQSLGYLREILAEYTEKDAMGKRIFNKILSQDYSSEVQFVRDLSMEENRYLNRILVDAIQYSKQEQDDERVNQLNQVYELLFV